MNPNQTPYSSQPPTGPKQLRRSRTNRKISGVCGGIAEYLDVDANLVRLLVVVGAIVTGGGLALAYLVALVIIPEGPAAPVWTQPGNPQPPAGYQQPPTAPYPPAATQPTPGPAAQPTPGPAAQPTPGPAAQPTSQPVAEDVDGPDKPAA